MKGCNSYDVAASRSGPHASKIEKANDMQRIRNAFHASVDHGRKTLPRGGVKDWGQSYGWMGPA
jgi:hypothetical protein